MFHEYQSELIQKSDQKVIIFVQIWSDLYWSMLVNTTPGIAPDKLWYTQNFIMILGF